jgi:hypothetical protein
VVVQQSDIVPYFFLTMYEVRSSESAGSLIEDMLLCPTVAGTLQSIFRSTLVPVTVEILDRVCLWDILMHSAVARWSV